MPEKEPQSQDPVEQLNQLAFPLSNFALTQEQMNFLKEEIKKFLSGYPENKREEILWESLRRRALAFISGALTILTSKDTQELYLAGPKKPSLQEYFKRILETPDAFVCLVLRIKHLDTLFSSLHSLEFPNEPLTSVFPYQQLTGEGNPLLACVFGNIGHDMIKIPAFYFSNLFEGLKRRIKEKRNEDVIKEKEFFYQILPLIYQGTVWNFEAFKQMLENQFPLGRANLTEVLKVVAAEGAVRSRIDDFPLIFNELVLRGTREKVMEITTNIEEGLNLTGNESGLRLLFYQMVKNSVELLKKGTKDTSPSKLTIDAKNCFINNDLRVLAVRIQDNGPGIDIASVLRAKQKLLKESGQALSDSERRIIGDWTALDLRIIDVINFIFERRVSGAERKGIHGGIGLAMAKEIIDKHGGCIWATNLSGQPGAKFLVLLDPSADGSLRRNAPELFQTEIIPTEILESIDRQLSEK